MTASERPHVDLRLGDCLDVLRELPDECVSAVITDPPYELGFMGRPWDASGIAYDVGMWRECLRVLKPGGHLAAFGGTRTYHRMTCAIEDAGFEIRDGLIWLYSQGMPKGRNVSNMGGHVVNIVARLHLYPPSHIAGAEMMVHELLKALVRRGHRAQVHLSRFCPARAPYERDGVEVYPRGTRDWQDEADKADVLVTHLDNTSTMVSAALALRKPLVQVLHNVHPATRMWASCRHDLLVYNSNWMAAELGRDPAGIVVRPPVHVDDYEVDTSGGYAVTLVNLTQIKGGLTFAQLATAKGDTEFIGVKGAYGEQLVPSLPNVEIREHGTDMLAVYRDTRVLIMPSWSESWGRTGVEAMCSGIPVIATDTPGLRESLGDAGTFLPRDATVFDWSYVIDEVLHDGRYAELSAKARSRAYAHDLMATAEVATFVDRVEALA